MTIYYAKSTGGFYDPAIHGSRAIAVVDPSWVAPADDPEAVPPTIEVANPDCKIPTDAVEITTDEHAALLVAQSAGKIIQPNITGYPVAVDPPAPSIEQVRASALASIDAAAGTARGRYITTVAGQEATYLIKAQQAHAYQTAGYAGAVPALVQSEADATGETAQVACDRILAEEAAWLAKAAQIETARRRGKVQVAAAADAATVARICDASVAELAAL